MEVKNEPQDERRVSSSILQKPENINGMAKEENEEKDDWLLAADKLVKKLKEPKRGDHHTPRNEARINYQQVFNEFENMSLVEQEAGKDKLFEAYNNYQNSEAQHMRNQLTEDLDEQRDDIRKAKVMAKNTSSISALVEIGDIEGAYCYRVVNQDSVDQTQLDDAPKFSQLRPTCKITPGEANDIIGVAFKGELETLVDGFSVEDALQPALPRTSKLPKEQQRKQHPPIWLIGNLRQTKENENKNKWNLWLLSRSSWEKMQPSRDAQKRANICIGKAARQFERYRKSILIGSEYLPEGDVRSSRERTEGINDFEPRSDRLSSSPEGSPGPEDAGEDYEMEEL
jgi:hypothetical protein